MRTSLFACVVVLLALFGLRVGTAQDQKAPMSFSLPAKDLATGPISVD
jgi:hypothetical protein